MSLSSIEGCSYGSEERRNRVLYEFHTFSLIITCSLSFLLFGSIKLKRVYSPLSNVVNAALMIQILSNLVYYAYYPYDETAGNCTEIVLGRVYNILIMFGELHQVYFIAKVLGLSHYRFQFNARMSISLETALQAATIVATISVLYSVLARRIFMLERNTWGLFIVCLQLYFIRSAKKLTESPSNDDDAPLHTSLIDANHEAVNIFEALSWLQVMPCVFAVIYRVIEIYEFRYYGSLDTVLLILDCLVNYLFYIKIIVLQEKGSNVRVEVVDEEKRSY